MEFYKLAGMALIQTREKGRKPSWVVKWKFFDSFKRFWLSNWKRIHPAPTPNTKCVGLFKVLKG